MAPTSDPIRNRGARLPMSLALGGIGSVPLLAGTCVALCAVQAHRAHRGPRPYEHAHPADAVLGPPGTPVRVAWLGDSLAAGLGVDHVSDTPAHLVARMLERPVEVRMLAVPGARTVHVLEQQVPRVDPATDLVVLSVGANDVAVRGVRAAYARRVDEILSALAPIATIALSIPDMATPDRMAEPLRSVAGARARWFDAARERVAAGHPHVRSVDVASAPFGLTRRAARAHLCADRFHPGPVGYRVWAERIAEVAHELLPPLGPPAPHRRLTDTA